MGIEYRLYHPDTKTYVSLGKRLSSEPRFEGRWAPDELTHFVATRPYGNFIMVSDADGWPEDGDWREVDPATLGNEIDYGRYARQPNGVDEGGDGL